MVTNTEEERQKINAISGGNEDLKGVITNFVGTQTENTKVNDKTLDEALTAVSENTKGIGDRSQDYKDINKRYDKSFGGYEDLTREYAKVIGGLAQEEIDSLNIDDKDWKGSLKNAKGEAVIDAVSYEDMNKALAKYYETEKIKNEFDTGSKIN
jgi:hypothetical protein